MINFNSVFFAGLFLSTTLFSQNEVNLSAVEINGLDINYRLYEKRANSILGTSYLDTDWRAGDIELKSGEIVKGYPLKYNLREQVIELRLENVVKVIKAKEIANFNWQNRLGLKEHFIACNTFEGFDKDEGFFEIIDSDDEMAILSKNKVEFVKANYNEVLLAGVKEDKFVKKADYFIMKNDKLMPIKTKKRNVLQLAGIHSSDIKEYVFKKNLKYNNEEDLKMIFRHYFYLKGKE